MSEAEEEFDLVLPDGEDEIQVIDDTPVSDQGRPIAPEISPPDDDDAEEMEAASEKVKRRIDKLTAEKHAERRAKEALVRERDEAVRIAQQAYAERQNALAQANQYEQGFVHQAKSAAEIEIAQAQSEYQRAFEAGDSEQMAKAVQKMTRAQSQKTQFDAYQPVQVQPVQQPVQQQPVQQAAPQINREEVARQTKFMRENPWFNTDPEMTNRAFQIDAHIRNTAPHIAGTDEYYEYIDAIMRREFTGDRFGGAPAQASTRPNQGVAPVSRSNAGKPGARKTVTLTESQVKLAKRLGITPQQYAAELIKEQH
jgi:hypothetical protein